MSSPHVPTDEMNEEKMDRLRASALKELLSSETTYFTMLKTLILRVCCHLSGNNYISWDLSYSMRFILYCSLFSLWEENNGEKISSRVRDCLTLNLLASPQSQILRSSYCTDLSVAAVLSYCLYSTILQPSLLGRSWRVEWIGGLKTYPRTGLVISFWILRLCSRYKYK